LHLARNRNRRATQHTPARLIASHRATQTQKRRTVQKLLGDDEWSQWSNREIARRCGVDNSFVSRIRGASVDKQQIDEPRKVERGGKVFTQKPKSRPRRRRQRKAAPIALTRLPKATGDGQPVGNLRRARKD